MATPAPTIIYRSKPAHPRRRGPSIKTSLIAALVVGALAVVYAVLDSMKVRCIGVATVI